MRGIEQIASYIPSGRISNLIPERLAFFGTDEDFVVNKIGVRQRSVRDENEEASTLAGKALQKLLQKSGLDPEKIDALVVVTQNPDTNIPHTAAIVHGEAGLPERCATFDVGLGCSGYVYGLSIMSAFLKENGLSRGILITSDPYSKIVDPEDKNTALLFGDAATATLIGPDPLFSAESFSFGTIGKLHNALNCKSGKLNMNGREVFNFAATKIPCAIENLLEKAALKKEDIDAYIFHQGSRYILETIASRLRISHDRLRMGLENIGNTISSSIPLLLEEELDKSGTEKIVLCGFGVGLSYGSCICKRKNNIKIW